MNIIFDLGGVVLHWNPEELAQKCFPDPEEREKAEKHFIKHPEWEELDRGIMDTDLILRNAAERSGLPYASLKKILEEVPGFLTPKADTLALIHRIKEKGHKLYVLSNMHHDPMRHLLETYSFFDLFDGKVASCWVGLIKPDAAIYRHILKEFDLDPAQTVFIDDTRVNVDAAAEQGIHPIHFKSAGELEKELQDLGCL